MTDQKQPSSDMLSAGVASYTVVVDKEEVSHDWKGYYDITCYHCQHEQCTEPSLFHKMGQSEFGYGSCLECKTPLRIVHDPMTNTMSTRAVEDI